MGEIAECRVFVTHDVLAGKIEFVKNSIESHQTAKEIKIPIKRTQFTKGKE